MNDKKNASNKRNYAIAFIIAGLAIFSLIVAFAVHGSSSNLSNSASNAQESNSEAAKALQNHQTSGTFIAANTVCGYSNKYLYHPDEATTINEDTHESFLFAQPMSDGVPYRISYVFQVPNIPTSAGDYDLPILRCLNDNLHISDNFNSDFQKLDNNNGYLKKQYGNVDIEMTKDYGASLISVKFVLIQNQQDSE